MKVFNLSGSAEDSIIKRWREELKAKGIEDFQLYYAIETLRRTAVSAVAAKRP